MTRKNLVIGSGLIALVTFVAFFFQTPGLRQVEFFYPAVAALAISLVIGFGPQIQPDDWFASGGIPVFAGLVFALMSLFSALIDLLITAPLWEQKSFIEASAKLTALSAELALLLLVIAWGRLARSGLRSGNKNYPVMILGLLVLTGCLIWGVYILVTQWTQLPPMVTLDGIYP